MASDFDIVAQINRYAGTNNNTVPPSLFGTGVETDLDYLFTFSGTVAQKVVPRSVVAAGSEQLELIFTTVLDGPNLRRDFYWYILEIAFVTKPTIPAVYGTRSGSLLTNQFRASGTINQAVLPGTTYAGVVLNGGSGVGGTADITLWPDGIFTTYNVGDVDPLNPNGLNTEVVITGGTGYLVGDVLTVPGTALGGATPANDLTLVVTQIQYAGDATPGIFTTRQRSLSAQVVKQ
jgi:hypothetical protein